ncbi:Flagellar biosynthesis protein FlhA [Planctomycetes bacterium Pan216]|uniref:Flagellar biosynthesis protein FlhA n=1 Tax=Kolteria novifilia TaxID=2527975 RepID=A0A518B935_9BACT|nr:Flagellar biosynthesis protein FlhA [Planctomycetes bacterium Pan216]
MSAGSQLRTGLIGFVEANQGLVFPLTLLGSLAILFIPLPPAFMDVLLSISITVSVLILMATVTVKSPTEFTVFPTVLLATTLFRLVLNIATTRLIMSNAAADGSLAAGSVIQAFGNFVAGGNIILGIVIFTIVVVVQFVVINRGSVRTSEVAARFALDGMPGRQMAIDADLNAGIIDEREAKRRRDEITQQADFYGSMDGAGKFVRGDAVASIIITIINIIGGLLIGTLQYGMPVADAAQIFTILTIGDGLVSQVPATLLSIAAGMLVTRQSTEVDLGKLIGRQVLLSNNLALIAAGLFLAAMAASGPILGTGLPWLPLGALSAACFFAANFLKEEKRREDTKKAEEDDRKKEAPAPRKQERPEDALRLDILELEVGYALIPLADKRKGGDLEERIVLIRKQLASELGIILPGVRLRDNPNLPPNDYQVKLKGSVISRATAYPGHFMAIDTGITTGKLQGIKTTDPIFEQTAYWIDPSQRERAEMLGYTVIEASNVVTTHLTDTIKRTAAELLNRDRVASLVEVVKETSPAVVAEVIPDMLKMGDVQRVLQNLLREGISIRDMETILETLGDYAARTKDPEILTEYVRHRLSRWICQQYRDQDRVLRVVSLEPALEDMIAAGIDQTDRTTVRLSPVAMEGIGRAIFEQVRKLLEQNRPAVLLVVPQIRTALKQMTLQMIPNLIVLSYNEVTRDTKIEVVGVASYQTGNRKMASATAGAAR